jgi:hypothetical protein
MADIAGYQPHLFSPSRSSRMRNRTSETVPSERSCLVGGARWQNSRQQERGRGPTCRMPAGTRHPFSMSFAASATMTSYASRSVLSLMQAALDAVPLLAAAPGVAASIAGTLAAWC